MLRPVAYWQNFPQKGDVATIWGAGNPLTWWAVIPAMTITAVRALERPNVARAFIIIGFLGYYVIWIPIGRVLFLYHYMPSLYIGYLALAALWTGWLAWRGADLAHNRWLMRALALGAPMGFLAVEAGWMVTELGRQPWVVYGILKTADAVTPMPGLIVPFLVFTLLYCFLGVIVVWLLYRQIIRSPAVPEWRRFYMPEATGERGRGREEG